MTTQFQRGERQTNRSVGFIVAAFSQLLKQMDYTKLTVADITEQAQVGRSTFYRHFTSKFEILVHLHQGYFARLYGGYQSVSDWLAPEPPQQLCDFLQRFAKRSGRRNSLAVQLGNDRDVAQRQIELCLQRALMQRLQATVAQQPLALPLPALVEAMNGVLRSQLNYWVASPSRCDAEQVARQIHRLNRGLIQAAIGDSAEQSQLAS